MAAQHARRLSSTAGVGLALILIGIAEYSVWTWWVRTRIWVPLETPVSLSKGQVRTPEFRINLEGNYLFRAEVLPEFDLAGGECEVGVRCPGALRMSWSVSKNGRVTTRGHNTRLGGELGHFHAGRGRYTLDLDIVDDGRRLNAGAPRLVVYEDGSIRSATEVRDVQLLLLFIALTAVGISAILRSVIVERQEMQAMAAASESVLHDQFATAVHGRHQSVAFWPARRRPNRADGRSRRYLCSASRLPLRAVLSRFRWCSSRFGGTRRASRFD